MSRGRCKSHYAGQRIIPIDGVLPGNVFRNPFLLRTLLLRGGDLLLFEAFAQRELFQLGVAVQHVGHPDVHLVQAFLLHALLVRKLPVDLLDPEGQQLGQGDLVGWDALPAVGLEGDLGKPSPD